MNSFYAIKSRFDSCSLKFLILNLNLDLKPEKLGLFSLSINRFLSKSVYGIPVTLKLLTVREGPHA